MSAETLVKVLLRREEDYAKAVYRVRELADGDSEDEEGSDTGGLPPKSQAALRAAARDLREAVTLVGCLRRLVVGRSVRELHDAFGAPGDFGYETPLGAALARLYRGEGGE